jgi:ribosomal protein L44E
MSTAIFGKTTKCEGCEGQDTQRIHRLRRGSRRVFRWGRRQLRRRSRVKRQRMLGGEAGVRVVNVYKILCIYLLYRCMMYTYLYNIIIYIYTYTYILYTHTHISPSLSLYLSIWSDLIWSHLISCYLISSHFILSYIAWDYGNAFLSAGFSVLKGNRQRAMSSFEVRKRQCIPFGM